MLRNRTKNLTHRIEISNDSVSHHIYYTQKFSLIINPYTKKKEFQVLPTSNDMNFIIITFMKASPNREWVSSTIYSTQAESAKNAK